MTMLEIFENHYNELTQIERDVITTTDLYSATKTTFDTLQDYKDYVKEYHYLIMEV